jgi:hypothetical protein
LVRQETRTHQHKEETEHPPDKQNRAYTAIRTPDRAGHRQARQTRRQTQRNTHSLDRTDESIYIRGEKRRGQRGGIGSVGACFDPNRLLWAHFADILHLRHVFHTWRHRIHILRAERPPTTNQNKRSCTCVIFMITQVSQLSRIDQRLQRQTVPFSLGRPFFQF